MSDFPKIPGYKISKVLGKGGMGIVYLAVQEALDRQVALKVTLPSLYEEDKTFLTRFVREAKATAMLQHPNIITIYDAGVHENSSYMAMEYISTGTLSDLKRADLLHNKICELFIGVAKGLGVAHQAGLVHRDIKPDNILIDKNGTPLVTDFGIVKTLNANNTLTKVGDTIGTPHYMSPEQIKAEKLDGRSDLYSLGIVLYNFLEGHVPFSDTTPSAVYIKHVTEEPPPLALKNSIFQSIISKALEKEPQDRFNNANEFVVALEAIMQIRHTPAPSPAIKSSEISHARTKMVKPVTEIPQSSNTGLKIGLMLAILALVGAGGYFTYDKFLKKDDAHLTTQVEDNTSGLQVNETHTREENTQFSPPENTRATGNTNIAQQNNETQSNDTTKRVPENNEANTIALPIQDSTIDSSVTETEQQAQITNPDSNQVSEEKYSDNLKETSLIVRETETNNNEPEQLENENIAIQVGKQPTDLVENQETDLIDKYTPPEDEKPVGKISTPEDNSLFTIKNLLVEANDDIKKSKLLRPSADNAYDKFSQVLILDPNNKLAKLGLIKIIKKYQTLAQSQVWKKNYSEALSFIDSAISIRNKFDAQGLGENIRPIIIQAYSVNRLNQDKQNILIKIQQSNEEKQRAERERIAKIQKAKPVQQKPDLGDVYSQAQKALKQKDYLLARKLFQQAAEQGHKESQNHLGRIYLKELGIKKDYDTALKWFLKSAKQNYAPAQDNLGLMYFKAYGTKRDFNESFFWYAKAANQGYADSQGILGAMYEYGRGVKKSSYKAVQWYKKAAKQGNKFAIKKLRKRGISNYD